MEVIYLKNFDEVNEVPKLSLVLGNFDGVHIGHAQLINYARNNSNGNLGVFTFDKPLYGIVSLSQKGMSMKGTKGNFLPPTPEEIGLPKKLGSFPLVSSIQDFSIQFDPEK